MSGERCSGGADDGDDALTGENAMADALAAFGRLWPMADGRVGMGAVDGSHLPDGNKWHSIASRLAHSRRDGTGPTTESKEGPGLALTSMSVQQKQQTAASSNPRPSVTSRAPEDSVLRVAHGLGASSHKSVDSQDASTWVY